MQDSFSFCGIDVTSFGLHYAPELQNTYVYAPTTYNIDEQTFLSHPGGYYFGASAQPKTFTLRCYYLNSHINQGILTRILTFFKTGKVGKLIFTNRNYVWYRATVISCDVSNLVSYLNGYVTINMKAYYPFGRCDFKSLPSDAIYYPYIYLNTGLVLSDQTPATSFQSLSLSSGDTKNILLYNGGSVPAGVGILITGDIGDGILISNKTTGQECKIVKPTNDTLSSELTLICDGITGKTYINNSGTIRNAFAFHDHGFLLLIPSTYVGRNIVASFSEGYTNVNTYNEIILYLNKWIYNGKSWIKIKSIDLEGTLLLYLNSDNTASMETNIVTMNLILISAVSSATININFIYNTTFQ